MNISKAENIANKYLELLKPFSKRIEIAGSIRRRKPEVKDIEIVMIRDTSKMFSFMSFIETLRVIKGEPAGKYMKINLEEGIDIDLFMCFPDNWGYIFAIRTGSADFSHYVLAASWVKQGFKGDDGYLTRDGKKIAVREETDLFKLCKLEFVPPELRNTISKSLFIGLAMR